MLIEINIETVVTLTLHLKEAQLEAMTNRDEYVPILPKFEIYKTCISHSRTPMQTTTDVLEIKSSPCNAKLLGKFFTCLASETTDHCNNTFLPKGSAHLLGPQTYKQVLKENNFFLTQVATIPVNLAYDAWSAIIDPNATSNMDLVSLNVHLLHKPWFLRIESVTHDKCLLITTRPNLLEAHAWIDENLKLLIWKLILMGIDPPSSLLPCCLDKPMYATTSKSYTEVLKQQFSLASIPTSTSTDNNQPPCKHIATTIIDYDSDQSWRMAPNQSLLLAT